MCVCVGLQRLRRVTRDRYSIEREIVGYSVICFLVALLYTALPIALRHASLVALMQLLHCCNIASADKSSRHGAQIKSLAIQLVRPPPRQHTSLRACANALNSPLLSSLPSHN